MREMLVSRVEHLLANVECHRVSPDPVEVRRSQAASFVRHVLYWRVDYNRATDQRRLSIESVDESSVTIDCVYIDD
jgi:hypothetical protein